MSPPLILVAHGTRAPAGQEVIQQIRTAVAERLPGVPVHTAYVDVIGPSVGAVLDTIRGPVIAVPAFLASGYHVRSDLPEQIRANGRTDIQVTEALGPAPELADAMAERLIAAGWRPGNRVLFAAAGSSDTAALTDVRRAAHLLGRRCGQPMSPSYITTAHPRTADLCRDTHSFIAPYLLAPGLFQRTLVEFPKATVAAPIGVHPRVTELIVQRYRVAGRQGFRAA